MSELRVWEIINPSDKVTVRATIEDAAVFGAMLQRSWLFLKPADGGEPYPDIDADKEREVILSDPKRLFSSEEVAEHMAAIFAFFAFMPKGTLCGGRSREEVLDSLETMLMLPPGGAARMISIMRGEGT